MDKKLVEVSEATLSNLSLRINAGELVCIVGRIGAGKSSLLSGLLSEMVVSQHDPTNPRFGFSLKGRTAYVAQQAWIQNLSVRDNILFGHAYDAKRYDEVINACAWRRTSPSCQVISVLILVARVTNMEGYQYS